MNGIHDLGGMTCFGPVVAEVDEPVFHENWERRVCAMMNLGGLALGPIDALRHAVERMDPLDYLQTSYYEHWLAALETRVVDRDLRAQPKSTQTIAAGVVDEIFAGGAPATRDTQQFRPRFKPGDDVVARNLNPPGHTRLPRYVRGRQGRVHMIHGNHVLPDSAAHDRGEDAQPLYSVRFDARALWGPLAAERDCLFIDMWECYLEAPSS